MRIRKIARFALASVVLCASIGFLPPEVGQAKPADSSVVADGQRLSDTVVVSIDPGKESKALDSIRGKGASLKRRAKSGCFIVLKVPGGVTPADFAKSIESINGVRYAEPESQVKIATTPNDPQYPSQWGLVKTGVPTAWNVSMGSPSVKIAIIDTGIDLDHPDLVGRIDSANDWDFVNNDSEAQDDNGHGTHCAGTAAASTNNGLFVSGVAGLSTILPIKTMDSKGIGLTSDVADGIRWAADHGARVISLSLGSADYSKVVDDAVSYALSLDCVVLGASGNENASSVLYPGALPGVITVGSTGAQDIRSYFSNYGSGMDICAPGEGILSTTLDGKTGYMSGTSMATPFIAGVVALIRTERPSWNRTQVEACLISTAVDLGTAGWDKYYGYGRVNAAGALLNAARVAIENTTISAIPDQVFTGSPVTPAVTVRYGTSTLVKGVDYEVSFSNNISEGTASATVSGIGNYTGSMTKTFEIIVFWEQIAGDSQYDTAAQIALQAYPESSGGSDVVILATGNHWADALGGSALAGVLDAPILLVDRSTSIEELPVSVQNALNGLSPNRVVILGGRFAVSSGLETAFAARYGSANITRISGNTHYDTADAVAQRVISELGSRWDGTAVFATGAHYADALAVSPLTVSRRWPIFLVDPSRGGELTPGASATVGNVVQAIVVGGRFAVPTATEGNFYADADGSVERIAGAGWSDTAVQIAEFATKDGMGLSWNKVAIATGLAPYDALAGGVLQAKRGSVLLLTDSITLSTAPGEALEAHRAQVSGITYFGGRYAVQDGVRREVATRLGR